MAELDFLRSLPHETQIEVMCRVDSLYDVELNVTYHLEEPGREAQKFSSPYELMWRSSDRWVWMARSFYGYLTREEPAIEYLAKLINAIRQGYLRQGETPDYGSTLTNC